jgi:spoIIIJ-associated protein
MEDYEFEGKTTEEAIENASRELDVPVEDLNIDVIEPGSAGIFGLVGGKKARIRVQLKDGETGDTETGDTEAGDSDDLFLAQEALRNILHLIPVEATICGEHVDGKISLNIEGDKSGLLIGRKGKTLDALQFIVNKIVNKALDKKIGVVVDSENYRKRRHDSLTQMALKMGEKAIRTKRPVTTSPLDPHDRRIIHMALKTDEKLDTRSRGDGMLKRVVIIPKK